MKALKRYTIEVMPIFLLVAMVIVFSSIMMSMPDWEFVKEVDSVVVDKQYHERRIVSSVVPIKSGNMTIMVPRMVTHPEKYIVRLDYENSLQTSVDDKEFYNSVSIGDVVKVNLYKRGDRFKIEYEQK